MKKILSRLIWVPYGLILSILELVNAKSRDLENKRRYSKAIIDSGCTFSKETLIGFNSHIFKNTTINFSQIGFFTYVGRNSFVQFAKIGNYCSISKDVMIGLGAHPLNMFSTSPLFYKANNALKIQLVERNLDFKEHSLINIGSDVWIGTKSIIMDGVTIGHGAVVAAGAIVTKDIPPYAIVAGVPAKIIKYRFSDSIQNRLLESKWWENEPSEIFNNKKNLEAIINQSPMF
ncbi:CatB-related O-acetyltransferase [Spirosoma fluviale]|uniref:Transferase hexapeptide (Six repeat-containing protein) n=1 Tax=Spirosoma fluviale TaxID=1597977 RepID=A0A286GRX2_9BACT|nr:CatB-related O-acetyltransferase [Spirosoma fluviale]SOD98317.1 transferase hexapeptide (six repeat-containing protein) [Spirosoma fluviale]